MTQIEELIKIRKMLRWIVKQMMMKKRRSEFDENEVEDLIK